MPHPGGGDARGLLPPERPARLPVLPQGGAVAGAGRSVAAGDLLLPRRAASG